MTTTHRDLTIAAVKRTADAYCEMQDALDGLHAADYQLYVVALIDLQNNLRIRSQKELAHRVSSTHELG